MCIRDRAYAANGAYHIQQTFSSPVYVVLYLVWLFALWLLSLIHIYWDRGIIVGRRSFGIGRCTNPLPKERRPTIIPLSPVSYTHLDVYKRQVVTISRDDCNQVHRHVKC